MVVVEHVDHGENTEGGEPTTQDPLTFYHRWFCRPVSARIPKKLFRTIVPLEKDALPAEEKRRNPSLETQHRKFTFLSRGALLAIAALVMGLLTALVLTLALTLKQSHARTPSGTSLHPSTSRLPPSTSNEPGPLAYAYSKPPVRLGILTNFPDPAIYYDPGVKAWFAFATNDGAGVLKKGDHPVNASLFTTSNLQVASSKDFKTWDLRPSFEDPLPDPGEWATKGTGFPQGYRKEKNTTEIKTPRLPLANVWSPDIIHNPNTNKYVLYYAARSEKSPKGKSFHCIGAATANSLAGPFEPTATSIACPIEEGGAIDPSAFIASNGTVYVAFKMDANAKGSGGECGNTEYPIKDTPIRLLRMEDDGVTPSKDEVKTIMNRQEEDGPLIEAPQIVKAGNTFFLFFSSGCTRSPSYNVKYATAPALEGPYTRAPDNEELIKTKMTKEVRCMAGTMAIRSQAVGRLLSTDASVRPTGVSGLSSRRVSHSRVKRSK